MTTILAMLHPRRWFTGLWLNSDFRKLWGSLTIVHFGGQITFLALPLTAALVLNATPFEVGVLTALEALPYPLFGLFAGVLVDRARKLPLIIACDVGRGLALLAIPVCAWLNVLSMPVLYVVGFLVGLLTVIGWPAYQVFMTERVGRENLVEANAKIGVCDSAAQLIGPGIAGALIQWLTAPFAIMADAFSFFFSAWMLRGIPPAETDAPKAVARSVRDEIREGLSAIWHNRTLRALVWAIGVVAGLPPCLHRDRGALRRAGAGVLRRTRGRALHGRGPGIARGRGRHRGAERALRHGPDDARRASRARAWRGS